MDKRESTCWQCSTQVKVLQRAIDQHHLQSIYQVNIQIPSFSNLILRKKLAWGQDLRCLWLRFHISGTLRIWTHPKSGGLITSYSETLRLQVCYRLLFIVFHIDWNLIFRGLRLESVKFLCSKYWVSLFDFIKDWKLLENGFRFLMMRDTCWTEETMEAVSLQIFCLHFFFWDPFWDCGPWEISSSWGPLPGTGRCFNWGRHGHWPRDLSAGDSNNKCY